MEYKHFNPVQDPKMIGLDHKLMRKLDMAREYSNTAFKITSGFRDEEKNKEVGGEENSSHLKGLGADIWAPTPQKQYKVALGAFLAGFRRILLYDTHVHLDIDPDKTQDILIFQK